MRRAPEEQLVLPDDQVPVVTSFRAGNMKLSQQPLAGAVIREHTTMMGLNQEVACASVAMHSKYLVGLFPGRMIGKLCCLNKVHTGRPQRHAERVRADA